MAERFVLVPHLRGPWLLRTRRRSYVIAPELGSKLLPLGGRFDPTVAAQQLDADEMAALQLVLGDGESARPPGRQGRFIWLRLTLLPAHIVDPLAQILSPLASWPLLGGQIALGLAGYGLGLHLISTTGQLTATTSATYAAAILLFLASACWHELGHAAALRREGYPALGIGVGMLLFIPVLYCDVTAIAALPRRGRLRVDMAGTVFQIAVGGLLMWGGALTGLAAFRLAGLLALAAVLWSLLPFVRVDGYWLLCDALGRQDLTSAVRLAHGIAVTPRQRVLAAFLILYRCGHTLFLLLVCAWLPWRIYSLLPIRFWLCGDELLGRVGAAGLGLGMALLVIWIWLGTLRRLSHLAQAGWRDIKLLVSKTE